MTHCTSPPLRQADIWSYGVLLWEIVTGEDITRFPSLALTKSTAPEVLFSAGRIGLASTGGCRGCRARIQRTARSLHPPLFLVQTGREDQPASPVVTMGDDAPPTVKHIFEQCTQTSPALRPSALQIIEWLRDI